MEMQGEGDQEYVSYYMVVQLFQSKNVGADPRSFVMNGVPLLA